jgi:cytochrome c-type biogenesis protein
MMADAASLNLWVAFWAGVLSFISPCVLPLIPSYLTYITGLTFAQLQRSSDGSARAAALAHSLMFILGFSAVFILMGGVAGLFSASLHTFLRGGLIWAQRVGGLLIFLFGLHVSGLFTITRLLGERRFHLRSKPAGLAGTFLVGVAFAAGWTPCIGPILGAILALVAGTSENVARGMLLLAVYSAGMGLPFLLATLLFQRFLAFFQRFRKYILLMERITGVLLMVVGVLLFFNVFNKLTMYLYRMGL